jgi:hypothetical protein
VCETDEDDGSMIDPANDIAGDADFSAFGALNQGSHRLED